MPETDCYVDLKRCDRVLRLLDGRVLPEHTLAKVA